jgi:hypothetical protein
MQRMKIAFATTVLGLAMVRMVAAISLASQDTFATTSEGWAIGMAGTQPSRQAGPGFDGQPGFLSHFSDSSSSNGKWLMFTGDSDWLGNYTAVGVTGINFWADEQVGTSLNLRIAFFGPGGCFYSAGQTITNSTAGPDWTLLTFTLSAANFTYAPGSGGTGIFAGTMADVTRFEIFGGSGSITFHGNNIIDAGPSTNTIGIDQITAVPEPSAIALMFCAGGCLFIAGRRRRAATTR